MRDKIAERLKAARKDAGFGNAREAAEALHVEYPTYAGHENGSRSFDLESAALYCRRFKVSLDWLVTGNDTQKHPAGNANGHAVQDDDAPSSEANIIRLWDLFNRVRRARSATQVRVIGLLEDVLPKRSVSRTPERQARNDNRD